MHVLLIKYLTSNTFYICVCRNEFYKIKIDKILFKIDNVIKKLSEFAILPIENEIWVEFEHKNINNSNLASCLLRPKQ